MKPIKFAHRGIERNLSNTPTTRGEFLSMSNDVDKVLEKLAKEVELAVHALYRGEMRSETAKVRTAHLVQGAKEALASATGGASSPAIPRASGALPVIAGASLGWNQEESDAVLRCINAWLSIGAPSTTAPDTKCIPAGKMLVPSWGERSKALDAVRRISTP
jgi:hypothetical protein